MGVEVVRSPGLEDGLFSKNQILIFVMIWILWLFHASTGNFVALARILGIPLGTAWIVWLVNTNLFRDRLNFFLGIRSRTLAGLGGIICSPFLHIDYEHITSNSVAYLIRGSLILITGLNNFIIVSVATALTSGLGVWLFGPKRAYTRRVYTVGASGVTYGYLGFLLARGYFEHEVVPALFSLFSLFFYYNRVHGLYPSRPRMSWQGHLFGFLGGVATAYYLTPIKAIFPFQWFQFLM